MKNKKGTVHVPVLLREVLACFEGFAGKTVVDGTFGGGGHSKALIAQGIGRVIGLDWDERVVAREAAAGRGTEGISGDSEGFEGIRKAVLVNQTVAEGIQGVLQVIHASYREMVPALKGIGVTEVDGVLLDLGLSSDQLDDPMRGLSYQVDGPLDMRLDSRVTFTAADILATWRESDLADLFWREADEPKSRKLAAVICAERKQKPIATTKDFLRIVEIVYPPRFGLKRSHPAARLFQALRVQVNGERVALETVIPAAFGMLKPGGKLAIITFQANEDRIVKAAYRKIEEAHVGPRGERGVKMWKKGLPTAEEVTANPRAHSAKLRVLEKLVTA